MKSKRGQMEIMGLAIIVILVSIGILFAIRFVVLKEPTSYKKGYTQSELASNMLSSMMRITALDCHRMSFTELFQACARSPLSSEKVCGNPSRTACEFIEEEVETLFAATFGTWNYAYHFTAKTATRTVLESGSPCRTFKSKQYPIPVDPSGVNTLFATLNMCD